MSVIVKDKDGKIILMCKGADSVITDRLSSESLNSKLFVETDKVVTRFANEGLRTLYLAQKTLTQQEWEVWNEGV
jgi:magnesium-transporting ATPase (P-type)